MAEQDDAEIGTAEAARRKEVAQATVAKALRTGQLQGRQVGRRWLIRPSALAAWNPQAQGRPRKRRDSESFP